MALAVLGRAPSSTRQNKRQDLYLFLEQARESSIEEAMKHSYWHISVSRRLMSIPLRQHGFSDTAEIILMLQMR